VRLVERTIDERLGKLEERLVTRLGRGNVHAANKPRTLLTAREAALRIGRSPGTVYALFHGGALEGCRQGPRGGRVMVFEDSVEAYLHGNAPRAGQASPPEPGPCA